MKGGAISVVGPAIIHPFMSPIKLAAVALASIAPKGEGVMELGVKSHLEAIAVHLSPVSETLFNLMTIKNS